MQYDGFNWQLEAAANKGFLSVYLRVKPPDTYKGQYSIKIDYWFILRFLLLINVQ
jgi:hypothetical protein